jgi:hypothetical protein
LTVDTPQLRRWAWCLTVLTIGWNSIEAIVAIGSGLLRGWGRAAPWSGSRRQLGELYTRREHE